MKVSCIIPTRNRRGMVLEAIGSVFSQTLTGIEVVVVDDGSGDGTWDALAASFPAAIRIRQEGRGPGAARNAGVAAAGGDLLLFLDSDDIWLPAHAEKLVSVITRGHEFAYGTTRTIDAIAGGAFLIPAEGNGMEGNVFDALVRWCFLVPSSVAVTRRAFHLVGGFPEANFGEDWRFFLALASKFSFGFAGAEPITIRRLHEGSLCRLAGGAVFRQFIHGFTREMKANHLTTPGHHRHLDAVRQLVHEEADSWGSVQDWFIAMEKRGLL